MSNTTWRIESKHHTESNACRALARLEAMQSHKPEHKRNFYSIDREISSGLFVVINWGG